MITLTCGNRGASGFLMVSEQQQPTSQAFSEHYGLEDKLGPTSMRRALAGVLYGNLATVDNLLAC